MAKDEAIGECRRETVSFLAGRSRNTYKESDVTNHKNRATNIRRRTFLAAGGAFLAAGAKLQDETAAAQTTGRAKPFIMDCQSHVFVPDVVEMMKRRKTDPTVYEKDGHLWIKMGDWHRKLRPNHMNVDGKLADMDANGIDVTALSINDPGPEWFGNQGPEAARVMHDFLAATAKQHRGRFVGLIVLPYQDRRAAERELERCVTDLDMRGILLYSNLAGQRPDEPQFRWVFARAVEMDLPVLLHPAKPTTTEQVKGYNLTSTMGNMFENTIALARLIMSGLFDEFPQLKLVCPHLGGTLPYMAGRLDHQVTVLKRSNQSLKKKPSDYMRDIYMDIVSPLPLAMKFAYEFCGPNRLLFSSDHPWVDPKMILDDLRSLKLPADEEACILGLNAKELFKITT